MHAKRDSLDRTHERSNAGERTRVEAEKAVGVVGRVKLVNEDAHDCRPRGIAVEAVTQEVAAIVVRHAQRLQRWEEDVKQLEERPWRLGVCHEGPGHRSLAGDTPDNL